MHDRVVRSEELKQMRLMLFAVSTFLISSLAIAQEGAVKESRQAMSGSPPTANTLVTHENFEQSQVKFRWAVQHFRELFPTQSVSNDSGKEVPLFAAPSDVQQQLFSSKGLGDKLEKLEVDCFIVLQDGKVAMERYFHGMRADTKHFVLSIHKSIVATVIASLIKDSKLAMEQRVDTYVPELRESSYKGVTIRQALDMLSSVDYSYLPSGDERPTFELHRDSLLESSRYRKIPVGSQSFILTLPRLDWPHGTAMRYKESDPAILVWAAEQVEQKRFASIVQQRLWSKIGAEHELEAVCDPVGFWTHYVSCSARDLARWGQMLVDQGKCGEQSVVPSWFIDDIRKNASKDFLREEPFVGAFLPEAIGYRSFFYLDGRSRGAIAAMGGYGQLCYINPDTKTVVVIFSSPTTFAERMESGQTFTDVWRTARAEELERWQLCRDICSMLSKP